MHAFSDVKTWHLCERLHVVGNFYPVLSPHIPCINNYICYKCVYESLYINIQLCKV